MDNTDDVVLDPQELVDGVVDLISLPEVYLRIRALMLDDKSRLEEFAEVVRTDPNLVAGVLRIVNSAYFGFAGKIGTISRALNFIGIWQLHNLVLGVSAVKSFSGISNNIIDMPTFWLRSVHCGVLSQLFAKACKLRESEKLFVVGLLHEIGHLILYKVLPEESSEVISVAQQDQRPLFQVETEHFGFHYGLVGKQLMQAWGLPDDFLEITECHPEPATAPNCALEASIVHIADIFSQSGNSAVDPEQLIEMVDPRAWEATGLSYEQIEPLFGEAMQQSAELIKVIL